MNEISDNPEEDKKKFWLTHELFEKDAFCIIEPGDESACINALN